MLYNLEIGVVSKLIFLSQKQFLADHRSFRIGVVSIYASPFLGGQLLFEPYSLI